MHLPVLDVGPLVAPTGDDPGARERLAEAIDAACADVGFFTIVGHGVDPGLRRRLDRLARAFFALPDDAKAAVAMEHGGRAWRGWFPVGGELTSGVPDRKEGLYFGAELGDDDPRVRAGTPLHGPNLFPAEPPGWCDTVLDYLAALTRLGHSLMEGIALALGLDQGWFDRHLTGDPLVLFRIFHYPPSPPVARHDEWGVGEHTDYGLLTILGQDDAGGLQVHTPGGWIDVPPIPDAFVCNLGDMLERMTGGRYRSTPHRVRASTASSRLSYPFFFDPAWDAEVRPLPLAPPPAGDSPARRRWDHADVHSFDGTYGEYLLGKVGRVFPELGAEVLDRPPA